MGADLLELRAHFGISATEALKQLPSWEYDLLVTSIRAGDDDEGDEYDDGPGAAGAAVRGEAEPQEPPVPQALKGMF